MIDDFAKAYLHDNLRWARESLLVKLEGLAEYDVRRPLTRTGTNLLGLVRHLTLSESRYLGEVFDRPFPEPMPQFDDPCYANHDHMWVTEQESRADILERYHRANRHTGHADIARADRRGDRRPAGHDLGARGGPGARLGGAPRPGRERSTGRRLERRPPALARTGALRSSWPSSPRPAW